MESGAVQSKMIILGGGCFWGVEDLLRKLPGITNTEVGYSGGTQPNPKYKDVTTGLTGHAEVVRITYNPTQVTLAKILDNFFRLHDPTTLNQQGNDRGTQYRSIVFFNDIEEEKEIRAAVSRAEKSGIWKKPIITQIQKIAPFYPAEEYHQDYLIKNPGGYTCHYYR